MYVCYVTSVFRRLKYRYSLSFLLYILISILSQRSLLRKIEGNGHFAHLLVAHAVRLEAHVFGGDVDKS